MLTQSLLARGVLERRRKWGPVPIRIHLQTNRKRQDVGEVSIAQSKLVIVELDARRVVEQRITDPQRVENLPPRLLNQSAIGVRHRDPPSRPRIRADPQTKLCPTAVGVNDVRRD